MVEGEAVKREIVLKRKEGEDATLREEESISFLKREIWCTNQGKRIYGIGFIPDTGEQRKPLIIYSHELGYNYSSGFPYAKRLAQAGYATYVFDYPGGTGGISQSDGLSTEMSVLTEKRDLEAVLRAAASWDFVDPKRIILMGGSQGGAVSALAGCAHPKEVAGMILLYPAFLIPDMVRDQFGCILDIPEEYDMLGEFIRVGQCYAMDAWDLDFYTELSSYPGEVLLLHGDKDIRLDLSYSQRAAKVLKHCEYHVIPGGEHIFLGPDFEAAMGYILGFLRRLWG